MTFQLHTTCRELSMFIIHVASVPDPVPLSAAELLALLQTKPTSC